MLDHLPFLSEGLRSSSDVLHFIKSLKIKSSRQYIQRSGHPLWQKKFYDYILRAGDVIENVLGIFG
jgi:hypothetical protein